MRFKKLPILIQYCPTRIRGYQKKKILIKQRKQKKLKKSNYEKKTIK
jgi:hypothetical protein